MIELQITNYKLQITNYKLQGKLLTNIILCGGSGTRLWPIGRTLMLKKIYKFILRSIFFSIYNKKIILLIIALLNFNKDKNVL